MTKISTKVKGAVDKVKENVKATANDISDDIEDKDTEFITRGDIANGSGGGVTGEVDEKRKKGKKEG
jgi:hypothetical protein